MAGPSIRRAGGSARATILADRAAEDVDAFIATVISVQLSQCRGKRGSESQVS